MKACYIQIGQRVIYKGISRKVTHKATDHRGKVRIELDGWGNVRLRKPGQVVLVLWASEQLEVEERIGTAKIEELEPGMRFSWSGLRSHPTKMMFRSLELHPMRERWWRVRVVSYGRAAIVSIPKRATVEIEL